MDISELYQDDAYIIVATVLVSIDLDSWAQWSSLALEKKLL